MEYRQFFWSFRGLDNGANLAPPTLCGLMRGLRFHLTDSGVLSHSANVGCVLRWRPAE